ncbi:hypothetical protein [Bacteriovorax sp. DB6_IX]|uniref:hypothetical protein n=1 Tax=Bacteriovorax sp. DB6_IX TaxID=1353530 RepID=UPI000554482D|nr:hypothetical protein [Bacteriovorax sp. DB6_IX]
MSRLLYFILFTILISCSSFNRDFKQHNFLKSASWKTQIKNSLEQRVVSENQEVRKFVNELKEQHQIQGHEFKTKDSLMMEDIRESLRALPKNLHDYLSDKVAGVLLIRDLHVPVAIQKLSDSHKYLLFIDREINSMGLNDWYRWREYSAFGKPKTDFLMEPYLSHTNSQKDTIDYILSQAIALLLSHEEDLFPKSLAGQPIADLIFIKRSWLNNKGIIQSKADTLLDEMKFISFYGASTRTFPQERIYEFYQKLEKTNFTNLYSSTGAFKDFIESMATYIHVFIFRRPFQIDFYEKEILLDSFSHCLNKPRCLGKRKDLSIIVGKYLK